jgi:hypothetical protein
MNAVVYFNCCGRRLGNEQAPLRSFAPSVPVVAREAQRDLGLAVSFAKTLKI